MTSDLDWKATPRDLLRFALLRAILTGTEQRWLHTRWLVHIRFAPRFVRTRGVPRFHALRIESRWAFLSAAGRESLTSVA